MDNETISLPSTTTIMDSTTTIASNLNYSDINTQQSNNFTSTLTTSITNAFELINSTYTSIPPNYRRALEILPSVCMVVGACMPYIPQYFTILRNKNHKGFSTLERKLTNYLPVCFTLLVSNILRVAFFIGHPFDKTLLVQSFVMIVFQILLLELCVRLERRSETFPAKKRTIFSCDIRNFWRWTNLTSYIVFIVLFTLISTTLVWLFQKVDFFVELIGYCATISESVLALPQAIENFKNKSVEGMSIGMVLMWLVGDLYKTGYFILNNQPLQFLVCGIVQITIDIIILVQVMLYRKTKKKPKGKEPKKRVLSIDADNINTENSAV